MFNKLLDFCVDDNGYNFFYRLVIGGNYLVFYFLRKEGKFFYIKICDGRNFF